MRRSSRLSLLAVVCLLCACATEDTWSTDHPIVVLADRAPSVVSPLSVSPDEETERLIRMLFQPLYEVQLSGDSAVVRGVLASAIPSPADENLQTFIVDLSHSARWQDGRPLTAS